jgi:hypothetical protein
MIKKIKEFYLWVTKENNPAIRCTKNAGFIEDEQQKRAIKIFNTFF